MATLTGLQKKAQKLLSNYVDAHDEARTPLARSLADTFVEAREHFDTAEGSTDWKGQTYPYRRWVRDVFDGANLRGEDSKRIQSAIRYHVGSSLRARLSPEQLEDAGLLPESPRERSQGRRRSRSAMLDALNARDVAGGALLAVTAAHTILQRVDAEEVRGLDENARAVAEATLKDVERRVRSLLRALR